MRSGRLCLAAALVSLAGYLAGCNGDSPSNIGVRAATIADFPLNYPNKSTTPPSSQGSTHELAFNPQDPFGLFPFWVSGDNYDYLAEFFLNGLVLYHPMPAGSMPHGVDFDGTGQLWVSFEAFGQLARIDKHGNVSSTVNVTFSGTTNPGPHGIGVGLDGRTMWFTGKEASTVGFVAPDDTVQQWALPTSGATPIYIKLGPDGNMWLTELTANNIARVTTAGVITEFAIPTANSRPIAITPEPFGGAALWFSEEAGNNVAKIDLAGNITEYPVPKIQSNNILAGLAFDNEGNLWTQQYVDQNNPSPAGIDHIVRIDKKILTVPPSGLTAADFTYYDVPTTQSVLHRITVGKDGNMWFTELKQDKIGRVLTH
jgi:virginiamycin B lyase